MSPKTLCSRHSQWHCSCFYTQLRISPCSLEMHICAGRCQASIRQVSHWWSYLSQLKQHRLGPWSSTSRTREREEWRRKMEAGRGGERAAGNMWCTAPRQPASQPASGTLMMIMSCHTAVGQSADLALVPALLQSIASICPRGQGARAYQ